MEEERHTSPDGTLTLIAERLPDEDDVIISFGDFPWHTHPDLLGGAAGARALVDDVLSDRLSVAIERRDGEITDIFVSFDPSSEGENLPQGVTVELRTWSGRQG